MEVRAGQKWGGGRTRGLGYPRVPGYLTPKIPFSFALSACRIPASKSLLFQELLLAEADICVEPAEPTYRECNMKSQIQPFKKPRLTCTKTISHLPPLHYKVALSYTELPWTSSKDRIFEMKFSYFPVFERQPYFNPGLFGISYVAQDGLKLEILLS